MDFQNMGEVAKATLLAFGFKVVGAIIAWVIGRHLIGLALRLIGVLPRVPEDAPVETRTFRCSGCQKIISAPFGLTMIGRNGGGPDERARGGGQCRL